MTDNLTSHSRCNPVAELSLAAARTSTAFVSAALSSDFISSSVCVLSVEFVLFFFFYPTVSMSNSSLLFASLSADVCLPDSRLRDGLLSLVVTPGFYSLIMFLSESKKNDQSLFDPAFSCQMFLFSS